MVTTSLRVGDESVESTISVEMSPIEVNFIAEALAFYIRGNKGLTISNSTNLVRLWIECNGVIEDYELTRAQLRKEGSL